MKPIEIALNEWATSEILGTKANPRIVQYFREVGRPEWTSDEIPWCAIFVNWCLMNYGAPRCGRGLAESFLTYGNPTNMPTLGDIVVFYAPENPEQVNHVAFFVRKVNGRVYILGGNQGDTVNIISYPETYVSAYRKIPTNTPPDHYSFKYNKITGKLNPNYNPNA